MPLYMRALRARGQRVKIFTTAREFRDGEIARREATRTNLGGDRARAEKIVNVPNERIERGQARTKEVLLSPFE